MLLRPGGMRPLVFPMPLQKIRTISSRRLVNCQLCGFVIIKDACDEKLCKSQWICVFSNFCFPQWSLHWVPIFPLSSRALWVRLINSVSSVCLTDPIWNLFGADTKVCYRQPLVSGKWKHTIKHMRHIIYISTCDSHKATDDCTKGSMHSSWRHVYRQDLCSCKWAGWSKLTPSKSCQFVSEASGFISLY